MRIVIGADVFYPFLDAGGEVHTYNVAKNLVKFGHDVTVISGKSSQFPDDPIDRLESLKDIENVDGINIIRAKKPYRYGSTFNSLPALYDMYGILKKMIKKNEVDVANFLMYRPAVPFYLAARNNVPSVLIVHIISNSYGNWKGWRDYDGGLLGGVAQKLVEDAILHFQYTRIMAVSSSQKEQLSCNYKEDKIDVVYNGVDLEKYDKVSADKKDPDMLIYVGTLKKRKNVLDAIRAVKIAREKSGRDLKLFIVSSGGELEKDVLSLEKSLGFIRYIKRAPDELKIKLLKESILFIFPTSKEGFPLVTLEALACETPFIVYETPEMREVHDMTKGGIVVPYGDIEALSDNICRLISNDDERKRAGKDGRKSVIEKFTWEAVARREEMTFKKAIIDWK
jgi:glycosyltransferase involved in cell wall biosynthesis